MSALFLLFSLTASAAQVHTIKLETQAYASTPSEISTRLEGELALHILKTCGEGEQEVILRSLETSITSMQGEKSFSMRSRVSGGGQPALILMAYPRGELEASFECSR